MAEKKSGGKGCLIVLLILLILFDLICLGIGKLIRLGLNTWEEKVEGDPSYQRMTASETQPFTGYTDPPGTTISPQPQATEEPMSEGEAFPTDENAPEPGADTGEIPSAQTAPPEGMYDGTVASVAMVR